MDNLSQKQHCSAVVMVHKLNKPQALFYQPRQHNLWLN